MDHQKIKVINGTMTNVYSTNRHLVRVHRNYLNGMQSAGFFTSDDETPCG